MRRSSLLERLKRVALTVACGTILIATAAAQHADPPAQPSPPPTPSPLPAFRTEIIVTPERASVERDRLPVATALATRTDIERLPSATLADVVHSLPGFHVLLGGDSGFAPAPLIRGFFGGGEAEYVKLLVDGIPLADPESGLVDWRRLPAFAIERVEALRGPGSGVYGDTALGGVVQAFTSDVHRRTARVNIGGGSFAAHTAGGELRQPWSGGALDVLASYAASRGFRTRSDLREGFTAASFRRSAERHQMLVRGSFNYRNQEDPGPLTAEQLARDRAAVDRLFDGDGEMSRRGHGAVRVASSAGPLHYSVLGHFSARSAERTRTLLLAPSVGDAARRDVTSRTAGVSLENALETARIEPAGQLRFGIDVSSSDVDTAYRRVGAEPGAGREIGTFAGGRWQVAAYATHALDVGDRVRVQGGVRWDRLYDRLRGESAAIHSAWSPRLGAAMLVGPANPATTVFGQVSRAFKAATVDQLFDPRPFPDFRGGTFLVSNPSLEPQRATSVEGGIRQSNAAYRWEVVLYRIAVADEIDFDPATFTYANIGRSTHRGAEFDAVLFPGARLSPVVQYAWTRVSPDERASPELQLKNIPRHVFRPAVTVTLPAAVVLHARYTRTAGAFADDQNLFPLGDRATLDVRIAKTVRSVTARVDLLNLTGDRYEEVGFALADFRGGLLPFYYPAQGFSVRAGLEWAIQKGR